MKQLICSFLLVTIITKSHALNRPVILTRNGNLEIAAAPGSDITFNVTSGGKLLLKDIDLMSAVAGMSFSLDSLKQCSADSKTALERISKFEGDVNSTDLMSRLDSLERFTNMTNRLVFLISRPIRRRINGMQRRLSTLMRTVSLNECNSSPCQNGGTCQDLYNSYKCTCPSNWEGGNCDKDVNECDKFRGTELGCQNDAKCTNTPGSYQCKCSEGWFGIHCTQKTQDCNNSAEVCGHGTCLPLATGFKCLCDQGWKTDGVRAACIVDVNECEAYHPPCSSNPPVQCVNLPGTFYCGHCPAGYTGNGFYCSDINECEIMNGGCSMYPMVQCINVPGSKICGPCPPGYNGNGITCTFQGVCGVGNGGCHPMAQCRDNPRISSTYVECVCPPGYGGDGYGPNGCVKGAQIDSCASNPCQHGTCISSGTGYTCNCTTRYTGRNCDIRKDPCLANPCKNGGTCKSFAFSFFCVCAAGFSGPYCQNNVVQCGQVLGGIGKLAYPPTDFVFNRNSQISCALRIQAPPARVLNITVHGVYIPSCNHNYFQIHDGKDTGSPLVGRFCDNKLRNGSTIVSNTDTMYLWLKGDALAPKPFINISWTYIAPVCGSFIDITESGTFQSPGAPQAYPPNRDCYWKLKAPLNKRMKFTFFHLDIGNNTDCKRDTLSFNEGLEPTGKFFYQTCKSGISEPVFSPSNEVTVHLHTIGSYTGFLVHYTLIEGVPGCGGIYTHTSGTISSPKTLKLDTPVVKCEYKIQLGYTSRIKLHFNDYVGVGDVSVCTTDAYTLAIYQGNSINSPLVGRYCTWNMPPDLFISDSQVLMVYKPSETSRFEVVYETVCGGTYTDETATIQSDNYPTPLKAEESIDCQYKIVGPPGSKIRIDFNGLEFDNRTNWFCHGGYVHIFVDQHIATRFCNKKKDEPTYYTENSLTVRFRVEAGHTGAFSLTYQILATEDCGGVKTNKFGSIESPRDLQTYQNGLNCTWLLSAPPGYLIEMNWLTFNLEESYQCTYDYVQIFDNATDPSNSTEMGKFCGNRLPPTMMSTSNMATVFFKVDGMNNFDGFYMSYRFITASNVCGGHYFTPSGIIKSPLYPLPYPNNRNCIWIITVPSGQQIQLNFTSFQLEESANCRYDYIQILNGASATSPPIGKYCGSKVPKRIASHTNHIYVQFVSDKTKGARGFEIQWSTTSTGCGGSLTSPVGTIISPNYPEPYGRNAECFWKIAVSAGSRIQGVFADLDLEYLNGCYMDFVDFYDGPSTMSKKLGTYCKIDGYSPIILSSGNHMTVKFHSDINYQGRGFQLQYSSKCTTNVTGFSGVIENPNFPGNSPKGQDCEWQINVPEGNKINITFSHFNLAGFPSAKQCAASYLEIDYMEDYEKKNLGKYCDDNPPDDEIFIKSNVAFIKFHYSAVYANAQFRLEWMSSGCGGVLTRPSGTIQTPNYPNMYPINTECNWHIQTEFGKSVEITFDKIDMELNRNCDMDYIKVYNGPDETYAEVAKFCHSTDKPLVITGTGRDMYVHFHSDVSYTGKGFQATYKTVDTKCGGRLTAASGTFHSPNYPNNYDKNDTCEWLIEVQENHLVELIFDTVDLLNVCNSSYIKIYDGPTAAYPVLKHLCGSNTPEGKIISRTNHMYIELVTHWLIPTKGFLARYATACGSRIETLGSGLISFNTETVTMTNVTNCTWTIIAQNPADHVLLTFSKFQNTECYYGVEHSLAIYDGETHNASLIGTYCRKMPGIVRSSGNMLHLEVPENHDNLRFTAKYSVLESTCGGSISAETGEFSTPNYPASYPVDIQCEWTLNAGIGVEIKVDFPTFDLVQSDSCNEDYLEIRRMNRSGPLIGIFCGNDKPLNITTMQGIWMYFKSERPVVGAESPTAKGFLADFALSTFVELKGENGTVTSPLYPDKITTANMYKWQITVDEGHIILIEFDEMDFDMGSPEFCYGASLTFTESASDYYFSQVCQSSTQVKTTGNTVTVDLHGASSTHGARFKLRWKQIKYRNDTESKCESSDVKLLSYDNATLNYNISRSVRRVTREKCAWTYSTIPGRHLRVVLKEFISHSMVCLFDSVTLMDGNGYGLSEMISTPFKTFAQVCNSSNVGLSFETKGDSLMVQHSTLFYPSQKATKAFTKFSLNVTDVCGGIVERSNGIIFVNGTKEPKIGALLTCKWSITVPTGRKIALDLIATFADSPDCVTKADVHNGHDEDSPVILTNCGVPGKPKRSTTTSGNKAFITFVGNYTDSLKIKYRTVSTTECGGQIQLTDVDRSAIITSPNYPNAPKMYAECIWEISVPNGEAIRVDFLERFDLQKSAGCTVDAVEIRDGATPNSPLIDKYCADMPGTITSLQNRMYIKYFTNTIEPRNGFKANVSVAFCGGTIRGMTGSIMSPGYNFKTAYPSNVTCKWELWAPPGHSINMTFESFDMPGNAQIKISDMDGRHQQLFNYTRQMQKPRGVIQSGGSKVLVELFTGKAAPYLGFKLSFEASAESCGGEMNTPSGVITSPNYPSPVKGKRTCEWLITVPKGRRIKFVFDDVDLGRNSGNGQGIACFSGQSFGSNVLFLTDQDKYDKIVRSSDNIMQVYFWSYGEQENRGFKASYTSDEPSICSSAMDEATGTIKRPSETTFTCNWDPTPPMTRKQTMALTVSTNVTGVPAKSCSFSQSSVLIRQENSNPVTDKTAPPVVSFYSDVIQQYCKTTTDPMIVRTLLPYVKVAANQKNNKTNIDFTVKYKVHDCGGEIRGTDDVIVSPAGEVECAWRLVGQEGEQYSISFRNFTMPDCETSYLMVYNGKSVKDPLVGKYCGVNKPSQDIQSQRHYLWLEYHGSNASSFNIFYKKQTKICGGIQHSEQSRLQTPSYPNNYDNNVECLWEIRARNGYHIQMEFTDRFQLEEVDGCANDFVSVYEKREDEKRTAKFCGRTMPPSFQSTGNLLFVLFRTNEIVTGSGFTAKWKWVCGGSYNASDTVRYIITPGYPDAYSKNLRCEYVISAPKKYIRINFLDFELEKSAQCNYDRVIVSTGNRAWRRVHSVYCGDKLPNTLEFFEFVNLTLITDRWVNKRGFRMSYSLSSCGGNITEPTVLQGGGGSTVQSTYYSPVKKCDWTIVAPKNQSIRVDFTKINITYNIYCYSQYIAALDEKGNKLAALCGDLPSDSLPTVHSNTNKLTLRYQSYNLGRPSSFSAYVYFTYGPQVGCGGFINLTTATSKTIDFTPPGDGYDCIWHVQTAIDYNVQVNFTLSERDTKCLTTNNVYNVNNKTCCVYYEMKDGNTTLADEVFSACDLQGPGPVSYVSSGNFALVRIASKYKAFKTPRITFTRTLSICGHLYLTPTNESQYITTPYFPARYPPNLRCIWRIKTKFIYGIHLRFEEFDLNKGARNLTDCGGLDRLEIVDRSNKAFHLDYDLVWKRKTNKWEISKMDSLYGTHKLCMPSDKGYEFVSTESHIQLSFFSDSKLPKAGNGFKIEYKIAQCNRNYTGLSGRIARMWHPGNCTAYITAPKNYTIALFFSNMHQFQVGCTLRWFDIYDGSDSKTPIAKLCGIQKVKPVFSTTNELVIQLKNSMNYGMYTSEMTYIASDKGRGCGGELYMFKGTFTSPLYPLPTTSDTLCKWNIKVPMGLQLALNLKWFDIKGDCGDNYLKLTDPNQGTGTRALYCSEDIPAVFISASGSVTVEYKSGPSNTGTGWRAAFMAVTSDFDLEKFRN